MKKILLKDHYALINVKSYCKSEEELINSESFEIVLEAYYNHLKKKNDYLAHRFNEITLFMLLTTYRALQKISYNDVYGLNPKLKPLLDDRDYLHDFTEGLYNYWRKLKKYGLLHQEYDDSYSEDAPKLLKSADDLNNIVNSLFNNISQKILSTVKTVQRQLTSSINASFLLTNNIWSIDPTYHKLQQIKFISHMLVNPPFMVYSKSNIRVGMFTETNVNPLSVIDFNDDDFLAYAVKVGPCTAFVYFHKDYMHHGVSICNLFKTLPLSAFKNVKPDLIYVYGIKETEFDGKYYYDESNDIYIGTVALLDKNDYFGYMKKMLLTLHNIYMIDRNRLPIHGAMVNLVLSDFSEKNIMIIGDSGAGKSETLEALRVIGCDYIKALRVIYDDMGTLTKVEDKIVSYGTETGAFIRIDDLEPGYAYNEIDRAILLNPNKHNARVILPVSSYDFIMRNHKVDYVFYANNYEDTEDGIKLFKSPEEALSVFKLGRRKAKGTTHEKGLVESYFANPFGPKQRQEKCDPLLDSMYQALFDAKIPVGELYTRLAIEGMENKGPQTAAIKLLDFLTKN